MTALSPSKLEEEFELTLAALDKGISYDSLPSEKTRDQNTLGWGRDSILLRSPREQYRA